MPTIDLLTPRLLLILGDVSANRFTDTITDEAWKLTLAEYSYAVPNIITDTHTVISAGREQALNFDGLISITQILFPWKNDLEEMDPHQPYYFYFTDGLPIVYIGGTRTPAVGDKLRITYAAKHTIDDVDGAVASTVPPQDFELLLLGAAGHAARLRTSIYSESFSNHPELKLFAIDNLAQYRATLRTLQRQSSRQPLPAQGFKLDNWDGQN